MRSSHFDQAHLWVKLQPVKLLLESVSLSLGQVNGHGIPSTLSSLKCLLDDDLVSHPVQMTLNDACNLLEGFDCALTTGTYMTHRLLEQAV